MRVLVVVAHPDDEIIGIGGTLDKYIKNGDEVHVLFMADGKSSRNNINLEKEMKTSEQELANSSKLLGYEYERRFYKDNQLDSYPLLTLVKECESVIHEFNPEVVYTHWGGDINIDHQLVERAVLTAARPIRGNNRIASILEFETLSESEWTIQGKQFSPNCFSILNRDNMERKISALSCYKSEIQRSTHPRNLNIVMKNAEVWGAKVGKEFVEPLLVIREML